MSKRKPLKVKCPNCNACAINSMACHETGCPSAKRPWVEWNGFIVPGDLSHEIYDEYEETEND